MSMVDMSFVYITSAAIAFYVALFGFYTLAKRQRNESKKVSATLDLMRESLEHQTYAINQNLSANLTLWEDMNHLLIDAQTISTANSLKNENDKVGDKQNPFLRKMGLKPEETRVVKGQVLILMPFHKEFLPVNYMVKNVCDELKLICVRSDQEYVDGNILQHIVKLIASSELVICEISGRSSNVFYELGIAHALGKKVVLISTMSSEFSIPFNLKTSGIILYKNTFDLGVQLKPALIQALNLP
jgi:hypothetical protein